MIQDFSENFAALLSSTTDLRLVNDGGSLRVNGFLSGDDEGTFSMRVDQIEFSGTWFRVDARSLNFNAEVDDVDYSGWMNFGSASIESNSFVAAFIQFQLPAEVSISVPYREE